MFQLKKPMVILVILLSIIWLLPAGLIVDSTQAQSCYRSRYNRRYYSRYSYRYRRYYFGYPTNRAGMALGLGVAFMDNYFDSRQNANDNMTTLKLAELEYGRVTPRDQPQVRREELKNEIFEKEYSSSGNASIRNEARGFYPQMGMDFFILNGLAYPAQLFYGDEIFTAVGNDTSLIEPGARIIVGLPIEKIAVFYYINGYSYPAKLKQINSNEYIISYD